MVNRIMITVAVWQLTWSKELDKGVLVSIHKLNEEDKTATNAVIEYKSRTFCNTTGCNLRLSASDKRYSLKQWPADS